MKIAIFSDNFYPEISGISDSIISLAKELAGRGHQIRFYVPRYVRKNYAKTGLPPQEIDLGRDISIVRLFSVPYPTGTGQGRAIIPHPFVYSNAKKFNPDIIHTQLFFGAGLEALWCARVLKKPLIGTNHTAIKEFMKYSPLKGEWAENKILRYVNWYYGKCDLITAPSRSVIDEMKFYGLEKESHVISNPLDIQTFSPLPNKNWLRKKFGFSGCTVVHAGRFSPERKIEVIIKAMPLVKKEFSKAELAVAGHGSAENDLKSLAAKLGISASVKFMGFLGKPVLAEVYNASEIFAITSTSDTQSMVMMQAMASGLPVIGVKARALPEYIRKNNGILVESDNPEALAQKIIFLFKNPEARKKLGAGARKFALNFGSESIAKEWEKIYEKAIREYNNHRRK
ncbi:MAG: glycosyltransferase [Candidatus Liptonbacteria bacterium]|nr:glycosyltransferase [Candidatus Liptonbacteria bacterium]